MNASRLKHQVVAAFAVFGALVAHADFTVSENLTLTKDLEWQYRGKMTIADGVTIDLNGHALHVGDMAGNGCITNSAAGDPAELHVFVPWNYTYGNATVAIGGNLRLFKDGRGTFAPTKTGQTYTGGTEVTAGTLKANKFQFPYAEFPLGCSCLIVDEDATFNLTAADENLGTLGDGHWYDLCGGTLANTSDDILGNWAQLDHVRLHADSAMDVSRSFGLIGANYGQTDLDLQGHTLSVAVAASKSFYLWNADITAGTLHFVHGGWLDIDKTSLRAEGVTLDLNAGLNIKVDATFDTLICRYNYAVYDGSKTLFVKNRFKPVSDYINNFQLLDGATLDLADRTSPFPLTSSLTGKTLAFADNATVTVDVHGRTLGKEPTQVVSWTARPANVRFVLDADTQRKHYLVPMDDGLYVMFKHGTMIILR